MFTISDVTPRRRKGQRKAKGHEIAAKVTKEDKIALNFDEAGRTWKALETTVPSLIVDRHSHQGHM